MQTVLKITSKINKAEKYGKLVRKAKLSTYEGTVASKKAIPPNANQK